MYFSEKSTAGEYTKEGENICPPSKIIYMKHLLILLGRMFLTLKHTSLITAWTVPVVVLGADDENLSTVVLSWVVFCA